MSELNLREVCQELGVSRRAIQGYEKAKLVSASGKTPSGYLLYDDIARERIKKIKLYRDMGFAVKEIKEIVDAPADILKPALINRMNELQKDIIHAKEMISILESIIEKL